MTPNFTGLNCRSCRRAEVFLASTYYCCVGDKTSDSLIDGFADLTIPCESRVPEPGLHLWPAARGSRVSLWWSLGKRGKSSSLWTLTRFQLVQEAEAQLQINTSFRRENFFLFLSNLFLASQPRLGYEMTGEMIQSAIFEHGEENLPSN